MKHPKLVEHNAILGAWHTYPPGSIERAKQLGFKLWTNYRDVDAKLKHWEKIKTYCDQEKIWEPLGLDSLDEVFFHLTGETLADYELGRALHCLKGVPMKKFVERLSIEQKQQLHILTST